MSGWSEIETAQKENRREIVLSGENISQRIDASGLDNGLFRLISLNFLEISNTSLAALSESLGNLTNLTNLVLEGNQLSDIPKSLGKLSKLKLLNISRNSLEALPEEIGELTCLTSLNASCNKLLKLPALEGLSSLAILNVSHNQLTIFPAPNVEHLAEIYVKNNEIQDIPCSISQLPALKCIDLSENRITIIPGELGDCYKLKDVNFKSNPLSDRRLKKLVETSQSKQVLDYVRQHCVKQDSKSSGKGKGKKGKRGKRRESETQPEDDDVICDEISVLHLTDTSPVVTVTEAVRDVRPYIVCAIVRNISFDEKTFKRFIALQTKLHDTVCEKRNAATIATHDLGKFPVGSLKFDAREPETIRITPLSRTKEVSAIQLYANLKKEAEALRKEKKRNTFSGIHKYLYLLEHKSAYPCLTNSTGQVISFPPITNSDISKISVETKDIFVEVTSSSSLATCKTILDTLLVEMLDLNLEQSEETKHLTVEQVKIADVEGNLRVVYPSRTDLILENSRIRIKR